MTVFAEDFIFLKNGNVIRGNIVSRSELKLVIRTSENITYEYPMIEIQRISDTDSEKNVYLSRGVSKSSEYIEYAFMNSGFWASAEIGEAVSCNLSRGNYTFTELNVTGGYRINEFVRFGLGIGARFYNNNKCRYSHIAWGMPIYADIRGNFISGRYRDIVPYYSFDLGASVRDGFMFRPGVGIRVGQRRSAFLTSLSYVGQNINTINNGVGKNQFTSFFMLKFGYEY